MAQLHGTLDVAEDSISDLEDELEENMQNDIQRDERIWKTKRMQDKPYIALITVPDREKRENSLCSGRGIYGKDIIIWRTHNLIMTLVISVSDN